MVLRSTSQVTVFLIWCLLTSSISSKSHEESTSTEEFSSNFHTDKLTNSVTRTIKAFVNSEGSIPPRLSANAEAAKVPVDTKSMKAFVSANKNASTPKEVLLSEFPNTPPSSAECRKASDDLLCLTNSDSIVSPSLYETQHPELLGEKCFSSRYMVFYWQKMGFGAALMSAVAAFRVATHQKRVFLIHAEWGSGFYSGVTNSSLCPNAAAQDAWQCYFEPISSCTVEDALNIAGVKTAEELRRNRELSYWSFGSKIGKISPDTLLKKRVVFIDMYFPWMSKQSKAIRDRMSGFGELISSEHDDLYLGIAMRYIIRLNPPTVKAFRPAIEKEVAKLNNVRASKTISLPIRGADKCGTPVLDDGTLGRSRFESACLPFETYMNAVAAIRKVSVSIDTVIITSEDSRYIKAAKALQEKLSKSDDKLRLVFNDLDEQQGDSRWENLAGSTQHSHAKIIFSMWSTLELQMHATYYVMNCNSHWHQWIRAIRAGGCGYSQPVFFCLDEQNYKSKFFMCTQHNSAGKSALAACQSRSAREI